MEIRDVLKSIGFEDQEITIYLFILKNGSSTQQEISDKNQIVRQTVYDIMKKMLAKGYVSLSKEGKKKLYTSISPEILLNRLKEKQESFEKIIPLLAKIKKEKNEVYSESFIGLNGLKNLFNMTLESKSEIYWAFNLENNKTILEDHYWDNYAVKRIEKKIPIKLLFEKSPKEKLYQTNKKQIRESKHNKLLSNTSTSFVLFDDKIILYTTEKDNLFGVFIKNKEIKEFLERVFMNIWKISKP